MIKSVTKCVTKLAALPAVVAMVYACEQQPAGITGVASWYGERYRGKPTASGELFNPDALTAAHRSLPFGTVVRCTYGTNTVTVRINDRGPFVKGRVIDLSRAAFARLCDVDKGLIKINIEIKGHKQ